MNTNNTRKALFTSVIALVICVTMLMGTTFAWFTDTAKVTVNTIQAGTLDVDIEKCTGLDEEGNKVWTDAEGATLNFVDYNDKTNILWEPGATFNLEEVRIANNGNLALAYKVVITGVQGADGENLATVLDVLVNGKKVDTLANVMLDPDGVAYGTLSAGTVAEIGTISLYMHDDAGNEYQNKSITDIAITVVATQYTEEYDSTSNTYDADAIGLATDLPIADVAAISEDELTITATGAIQGEAELDAGFVFATTETVAEAQASAYRYWHADYVVTSSAAITSGDVVLAGYYAAYCDGYNQGNWVSLSDSVAADTEIRLLKDAMKVVGNYEELCNYIPEFKCGIITNDNVAAGTEITVELRLYETEEPSEENNNSHNVETGHYIVISTYTYTVGE